MRHIRLFALALALFAPALGCGDKSCKNACDRLKACAINSSGLSCDSNCGAPDDSCAVCVNGTSCDDVLAGKCAGDCPKAVFTK